MSAPARLVCNSRERSGGKGEERGSRDAAAHSSSRDPLAGVSVLLLTKNGERYLAELLEGVSRQEGTFSLREVIAVDSGSRDRTLEILRRFAVKIIQIPPQAFGHGKTRNLAAAHAQGEYLVFLTQDATPVDERWLDNLLAPLRADPEIAGAYSRQLPRPHCHPMEWRRIVQQELSGAPESRVSRVLNNPDYARNPGFYYFFSNVSAVLRQSIWKRFPLATSETAASEFAEDQLWAKQVLEAGYKTAYCADSLVYHSHSYGPWDNFGRHFDHAWALLRGPFTRPYQIAFTECVPLALRAARADLAFWRHLSGQSKIRVSRQWAAPAVSWHLAANFGLWLGEWADRLPNRLCSFLSYQERVKQR